MRSARGASSFHGNCAPLYAAYLNTLETPIAEYSQVIEMYLGFYSVVWDSDEVSNKASFDSQKLNIRRNMCSHSLPEEVVMATAINSFKRELGTLRKDKCISGYLPW